MLGTYKCELSACDSIVTVITYYKEKKKKKMSRTSEDAYTGTPGREDQREERDQSFAGFSDPPLRGAHAQNPRRGGWDDPDAVQALFEEMQRRMTEMEEQILQQGKTQQDQTAQISLPPPVTSGVGPIA